MERTPSPRGGGLRVAAEVIGGLLVAIVTWWLINTASANVRARAGELQPLAIPLAWFFLISFLSTAVLRVSLTAHVTATVAVVMAIALALTVPEAFPTPREARPGVVRADAFDVQSFVLRGVYSGAMLLVAGAWAATATARLVRRVRLKGRHADGER